MTRPAADVLWRPSPQEVERAQMTRFTSRASDLGSDADDFAALHRWSVDNPREFWASVWDFCGIEADRPWTSVVDDPDRMPGARWFQGSRLNFASNLLRRRDDAPALISWNEEGRVCEMSFAQLAHESAVLAGALEASGVEVGDRIAGYMPNRPEAVVAMLAAARLGAIWSSCSPDFGLQGVLDRFGQIRPKVLFAAQGYLWNGKTIDCRPRLAEILERLPDLEHTVVTPLPGRSTVDLAPLPAAVAYDDFVTSGEARTPAFRPLPFDHPLYVMYSSGTTGLPKCMVHSAGGTLIQHLKEHVLHGDLSANDRIFYYTTCGWMMWNWLVSALAVGASLVLYDGAPLPKRRSVLFDMAEAERISVFGTSAKYIALAEQAGLDPGRTHDLSALKSVLSTGSTLPPAGFDFVYRHVKKDLRLSSITGGTDLISCFALGNPILPVRRGELQSLGLGMKVEVWGPDGRRLPAGVPGELVCTRAFPSMPTGFWNDEDGAKYRRAYFDVFPGVWRHGDWVEATESGGLLVHGRSDATLNPGGVRIGTAEIYGQVEKLDEVVECVAVGQDWEDDVRIILFVRLAKAARLDAPLNRRIRTAIRTEVSPRHVPALILEVPDVPRTLSGKISELAVRNTIHRRPVTNLEALSNPESLRHFQDREELQGPAGGA